MELKKIFSEVPDFRKPNFFSEHLLSDILLLSLLGTISGAESDEEIVSYGLEKEIFLRQFLELPNGIMRGLNKVTLIGNLGKDPEFQYLEGNIAVAKISLATTETFKDNAGTTHSQTEWHNVVLWRNLAELAKKYLLKGSLVFIEGKLKTRSFEDKEGNKKYVTEIIAEQLILLDKKTDTLKDI